MKFVIDIDNHLLYSDCIKCEQCGRIHYDLKRIDQEEINIINEKYDNGDLIIFWTGRGWDLFEFTAQQLKEIGVKYHSLVMGKPLGIYIDKESHKSLDDFDSKHENRMS